MSTEDWTQDEQARLEEGLLTSIAIVDQREKWKAIALVVGTRDAKACAARFQLCRRMARSSVEVQECSTEEAPPEASVTEAAEHEDFQVSEDRAAASHGSTWWSSRGGWNDWSSSKRTSKGGRGHAQGQQEQGRDSDGWWEAHGWGTSTDKHQRWSSGWEGSSTKWQDGDAAWDAENATQSKPLNENERRALEMREEIEANRERMRQRQERLQEEEARKEAKKSAQLEEMRQKRQDHAEAQDKKYQEAIDKKNALREQERQKALHAKREAERTDIPFFGPHHSSSAAKAKSGALRSGWAAAAGSSKGALQRQRKDEEMERRAAEVMANLGGRKNASKDNDSGEEEEASLAPAPPVRAPPKAPAQKPAKEEMHDRAGGSSSSAKGVEKSSRKPRKPRWWERMDSSNVCPISLAPICELPQAPFALEAEGSSAIHYYDARFLANFLVSSCDFIDPVNRRELTHEECKALDRHLQSHHPENTSVSVADAFALFEINGRGGAAAGDDRVQREATAVLQHLFRFQSARRTDRSGHAINYEEGGLRVVDDDDILTAAPRAAAPDRADHEHSAEDGAEYPDLGAGVPKASATAGSWQGRSLASSMRTSGRLDHCGREGYPAPTEAFPSLPSMASSKGSASAKPKGAASKAASKAASSRGGASTGRGGGGRGKQHQPKAWGKPL